MIFCQKDIFLDPSITYLKPLHIDSLEMCVRELHGGCARPIGSDDSEKLLFADGMLENTVKVRFSSGSLSTEEHYLDHCYLTAHRRIEAPQLGRPRGRAGHLVR